MTKNLDQEGLSSIVHNYSLFYIDIWGVVHNGISPYLEAFDVLKKLKNDKKEFVLLTNAQRPNNTVKIFLGKMGIDNSIRSHVFSSGEASLEYLKKKLYTKKLNQLGPPREFDLFIAYH